MALKTIAKSHPLSWWRERSWEIRKERVRLENKRKWHGMCEMCLWKQSQGIISGIQVRMGEYVCHGVRKARGLQVYFYRKNLYWGCHGCNAGDHFHPGLYQEYHKKMLGSEVYEHIESLGHQKTDEPRFKPSIEWYQGMIEEDRKAMDARK